MYKAVSYALGEVGYLEKASYADLDSKQGNPGYANITKYARDLDRVGYFNTPKQGAPWCSVYISAVFYYCYGMAMAQAMLCLPPKSAGAGCTQAVGYYKAKGRFYKKPQIGDQIFFTWGGEIEHTGLVYALDKERVYTVEGNTSDTSGLVSNGGAVCRKSYPLNSSLIYGYGRPYYNLADNGTADGTEPPTGNNDGGNDEVNISTLKYGATGSQVKALQALLIKRWSISCGIYGMDGDFGNDTLKAVNKFKGNHGLTQNGVVDAACWAALLGVS